MAAWVAANGVPLREPAVHHALLAALLEDLLVLLAGALLGASACFTFRHALHRLLLRDCALARALAGARIGPRPLPAHGQATTVPHAAVTADLHQALHVEGDLFPEIALDAPLLLDHAADLPHVVLGEVLHADVPADPRLVEDPVRAVAPDAEDVGQSDFHPLGPGEVHACDTCHALDPRGLRATGYRLQAASAQRPDRACRLQAAACCLSSSLPLLVL